MNRTIEKTNNLNSEKTENISNSRRSKKTKNNSKSKLKKTLFTLLAILIIIISIFAFLLYGPYKGFRDWLITTAMTTMTHQWIAEIFYDDETIQEVLNSNRVDEVQEEIDTNAINISNSNNQITYENEYEKAVLEKENPDDKYKIIKISDKNYDGYIAVIYDPSKIHTLTSPNVGSSGQYLVDMAKRKNAIVAINGGNFEDLDQKGNGSSPLGITYVNGKLAYSNYYSGSGGIIGFDKNDKLVFSSTCTDKAAKDLNIRDCVTCAPFLIINGKASKIVGNGGWGTAPRTAIGQRKDGIVLFLVIDGRRVNKPGATIKDLITVMQNYGAYNAANLDGGTSSAMVVNNKIINDPMDSSGSHRTRPIATAFGLIDE